MKAGSALKKIFFLATALILCIALLNLPVSTRQGINFSVRTIKIPFYVKISEFITRDYRYRAIVKEIIKEHENDEEKVMAIFQWVSRNIKTDIPQDWPIVDDHVWNIVVRGYGVNDQLADLFTTLCVYAGFDTRIVKLFYDSKKKTIISAIKLKGEWILLDPYHKLYFTTPSGRMARVKDLLADPTLIKNQASSILHRGVRYNEYFKDLPFINFDELPKPRAYRQNFFRRIYYEVERAFVKK